MPTILGSGEHCYRVVETGQLPDGWEFTDVAAVAVDSKDRIYVFNRGEHPMMVFDRDGNFLRSWGEGLFSRAHGIHIDTDDNLYCTDDGDHTVRKCTTEGKVLLTIGMPNQPAPFLSGKPFNRCTHTALSPKGEIYVSDGYGNARVHKYSPDGQPDVLGRPPAPIPASSTSCTTSPPTPTAGSMSPTARTIACRCSTATASTRRSGTTCTGPARSTAVAAARSRTSSSASSGPACRSTSSTPNLGPRLTIVDKQGKPDRAARRRERARPGDRQVPRAARPRARLEGRHLCRRGRRHQLEDQLPDTPMPKVVRCLQKLEKSKSVVDLLPGTTRTAQTPILLSRAALARASSIARAQEVTPALSVAADDDPLDDVSGQAARGRVVGIAGTGALPRAGRRPLVEDGLGIDLQRCRLLVGATLFGDN